MIELEPASAQERRLWEAALDVAERMPRGWTLIGAQMVALHAIERGRAPIRSSADLDALVDLRAVAHGIRRLSELLVETGFELTTITPDGRGHRFAKGSVAVDVLAPDGLGARADLTTIPPARTIAVPGGTQALRRTELVEVRLDARLSCHARTSSEPS